jgi:sugar O-acyltransferase (sialic acid O-acetyltransferase NeuD family)
MTEVVLYGIGSPYAVDVIETCARLGWRIAYYVDNIGGERHVGDGIPVIAPRDLPNAARALGVLVPLVTPGHRLTVDRELSELGFEHRPALLDPTSVVASTADIAPGVQINAASTIAGAVRLGRYALVNRSCSVGHHATLEDYATLGPGVVLAGAVHLEAGAFVGAGATVLPERRIGRNAIVGAGAVVTRDVSANTVVVGSPARILRDDVVGYNGVGV